MTTFLEVIAMRLGAEALDDFVGALIAAGYPPMTEAHQRTLLVGKDRGDERSAGPIGMFRDAPNEGHRIERRGQDQLLTRLQPEPDPNGDLRQTVEKLGMGGRIGQIPDLFVHDPGLSRLKRWVVRLHGPAAHATSTGLDLTYSPGPPRQGPQDRKRCS